MADILTVIAKLAAFDPAFYPAVLLFGQGDGFPVHAHSGYSWAPNGMTISYQAFAPDQFRLPTGGSRQGACSGTFKSL
jgi:hypothetical protein